MLTEGITHKEPVSRILAKFFIKLAVAATTKLSET